MMTTFFNNRTDVALDLLVAPTSYGSASWTDEL